MYEIVPNCVMVMQYVFSARDIMHIYYKCPLIYLADSIIYVLYNIATFVANDCNY